MSDPVDIFQGKTIAIGVPKTISAGVKTNVHYVVYCTFNGSIENSTDQRDETYVLDEDGNDVSRFAWYSVPGKYTIEIRSRGNCPPLGVEKAPTGLVGEDLTLTEDHNPTNAKIIKLDLGSEKAPTGISAADKTLSEGPSLLGVKAISYKHKPNFVKIINLELDGSEPRDFVAAKILELASEAPSGLLAEEQLISDDAPTSLISVKVLDSSDAPTNLELDIDMSASDAPTSIVSIEVLGANQAPTAIYSQDTDDWKPRNVRVTSLYLGEEMLNYHPRNVRFEDLTLSSWDQPGGMQAAEWLRFRNAPQNLEAIRFLETTEQSPTGLSTEFPINALTSNQAPTSISSAITIIQDADAAPSNLRSVNYADLAPTGLTADTTTLGAENAPTGMTARERTETIPGYTETGPIRENYPLPTTRFVFEWEDEGFYDTFHFSQPFVLDPKDIVIANTALPSTGTNVYGDRISAEYVMSSTGTLLSAPYYPLNSTCQGLDSGASLYNYTDFWIGENSSVVFCVNWAHHYVGDLDCDGDGYFDTSTRGRDVSRHWYRAKPELIAEWVDEFASHLSDEGNDYIKNWHTDSVGDQIAYRSFLNYFLMQGRNAWNGGAGRPAARGFEDWFKLNQEYKSDLKRDLIDENLPNNWIGDFIPGGSMSSGGCEDDEIKNTNNEFAQFVDKHYVQAVEKESGTKYQVPDIIMPWGGQVGYPERVGMYLIPSNERALYNDPKWAKYVGPKYLARMHPHNFNFVTERVYGATTSLYYNEFGIPRAPYNDFSYRCYRD